jgi:hypothetical protein
VDRETLTNTAIGALLVLAVAVPCVAIVATLHGIELAVLHFWPSVAHKPDAILYFFSAVVCLYACAQRIRKQLWMNGILCFAIAVTIVLPVLAHRETIPPVILYLAFLPPLAPISRWEFTASACIISLALALNSSLLGNGVLAPLVTLALFIAIVRHLLAEEHPYRPGWPSLLSSTGK